MGANISEVFFSEQFQQKFQVIGVVETHVLSPKIPDMQARCAAQGFNVHVNPAMQYTHTVGNHGGEAILTSKHMYAVPIDESFFEIVKNWEF